MQLLNDVLGTVSSAEPPMRDLHGYVIKVHTRRVPGLHQLTDRGSNEGDTDETRLPAPDQLLLTRLDETALSELIERHLLRATVSAKQLTLYLRGDSAAAAGQDDPICAAGEITPATIYQSIVRPGPR